MLYAVIAPLIRLPRGRDSFDYFVPEDFERAIAPGVIVDIPFRKRTIKGVVLATHNKKPPFSVRPIKKILTSNVFLPPTSLLLAQSISRDTATPLSIVLKSFLPTMKVRELADLLLPAIKSPGVSATKPVLLHWHTIEQRNDAYRRHAESVIKTDTSVLVITPREVDIAQLEKIFIGLPVVTLCSDKRIQHVWEAWKHARSGKPIILIGTRSAIFAPFANLGLIIVDQEHDENLKQEEPNPRYHARTAALELAKISHAALILASPVPSLESFHAAKTGVLDYQEVGEYAAPEISLVNLDDEHKKDRFSYISPDTLASIGTTLADGKSTFLLVDRLGSATVLSCSDCGFDWKCPDCGAFMALHETEDILRCGRCGATSTPPTACPKCHGVHLKRSGAGTERITALLSLLRPQWPLVRLDSLTASKTPPKSLDFDKPSVIIGTRFALAHINDACLGVTISLTTDQLLSRPDFRTHENTYRLLSDLARRSGHLIVHTRDPSHWVLLALTKPYNEFYNEEARVRERWGYPPFVNLTRLILQDVSKQALLKRATVMHKKITAALPELQISEPYLLQPARLRNRWRMGILVKSKDLTARTIDWTSLIDADTIVDVQPNSIT